MTLNETPSANRLHIALYGRRNNGKSSLINALTGQKVALVSDVAGTTTDPVSKAMEVPGIGSCVFIDTAGFDDNGELGLLRVERTLATVQKVDIALLVYGKNSGDGTLEEEWFHSLTERKTIIIPVIGQADCFDASALAAEIHQRLGIEPCIVSAVTQEGIPQLLTAITRAIPEGFGNDSITARLTKPGDIVLLVMPQDTSAPKGRLILPQVQTIRDLLDRECISVNATPETMEAALASLKRPPDLIITDSQAFAKVSAIAPKESRLTSFSILFAAYKGDLDAFVCGAEAVEHLNESSRVLIAEACTHAPATEDIGRVKIPSLLRKRFGQTIQIDVVSGMNFPSDLSGYDLIIHCGGCMFNRRYLLSRIEAARGQNVPITNYGVVLAKLNGILDRVSL